VPPGYPVMTVTPPPPPVAPGGQRLAEFGERLAAYLIDLALLTGVSFIVQIPFFIWFFTVFFDDFFSTVRTVNQQPYESAPLPDVTLFLTFFALAIGLFLVTLGLQYLYEVEMMFRSGQTLGKRIMKLRVIPLAVDATLTRGMAAKRFLVQYVGGAIVPALTYIDGFWQLWDKPYRQCLHDKFATTVVIKLDS